jgi:hypothetical protein
MRDTPQNSPDRYVAHQARNCDCFEVRDTQTDTVVFGCAAMTEHIASVVARQMSSAYRRAARTQETA